MLQKGVGAVTGQWLVTLAQLPTLRLFATHERPPSPSLCSLCSSSDKEVKCNVKMLDEEEAVFVLSASDCGRDLLRRVSDR